jgi:hypothetical protein
MARKSKEPSLQEKIGRCVIAIMSRSPNNRPSADPLEIERHEWLKRAIYDQMSLTYGAENNPLEWFDEK